MKTIREVILSMIQAEDSELDKFLSLTTKQNFDRHEMLNRPGHIPNDIFFINKGLIRITITNQNGTEHTIHFAFEHQFITDYSCFLQIKPSLYSLQALEKTEVIILPRAAIEWGYKNLKEGEKLGRLIAEYYFIYQDNRILNQYARTPKQRYDSITEVFPDIHNRVPQHMIASYLGISPVHLSRLKKAGR